MLRSTATCWCSSGRARARAHTLRSAGVYPILINSSRSSPKSVRMFSVVTPYTDLSVSASTRPRSPRTLPNDAGLRLPIVVNPSSYRSRMLHTVRTRSEAVMLLFSTVSRSAMFFDTAEKNVLRARSRNLLGSLGAAPTRSMSLVYSSSPNLDWIAHMMHSRFRVTHSLAHDSCIRWLHPFRAAPFSAAIDFSPPSSSGNSHRHILPIAATLSPSPRTHL
jgi:hypothetical protein